MTPIDAILEKVEWTIIEGPHTGERHATHEGAFDFAGHRLRCYRLNTGEAVFNADDFEDFMAALAGVPDVYECQYTPDGIRTRTHEFRCTEDGLDINGDVTVPWHWIDAARAKMIQRTPHPAASQRGEDL